MSAPPPLVSSPATPTPSYVETKDEKRSVSAIPVAATAALPTIAAPPRATAAVVAPAGAGGIVPLRRWVIHLDQPANQRWRPLIDAYKHEFQHALTYLTDMLGTGALAGMASYVLKLLTRVRFVMYHDELKAISEQSGFDLGKLVMLQLAYEAAAHCTSIVIPYQPAGATAPTPIHGRTMDWESDFLSRMTVDLDFQVGGRTRFLATTWAGYVGVLTGVRPGGYSVSVNFRVVGDGIMTNLKRGIKSHWPIGFLVRTVLTDAPTYAIAVGNLTLSQLMAPCYIIVAGALDGQGTIITRDRNGHAAGHNALTLLTDNTPLTPVVAAAATGTATAATATSSSTAPPPVVAAAVVPPPQVTPLVQTNQDYWDNSAGGDILSSRQRRTLARQWFTRQNNIIHDVQQLWTILDTPPILNDITIYTTVMDPARGTMETRVTGVNVRQPVVHRCIVCSSPYSDTGAPGNHTGRCSHSGTWHDSYDKCSKLKCLAGVGLTGIGDCHWSCCFSTDRNTPCSKSPLHRRV